jgi:hypothetical protein
MLDPNLIKVNSNLIKLDSNIKVKNQGLSKLLELKAKVLWLKYL